MKLAKKIEEVTPAVLAFRHYIHENAELAMQEFKATARIMEELSKLPNIEARDLKPGVVAMLKGGKPGKTLALRADMDALTLPEDSGLPFACKSGKASHSCGHDMHASILLGCAMALSSMADEISGVIKFFFQPAEETLSGARHLIDNGCMENPKVDAIFALHSWPYSSVGAIALRKGVCMASADSVDIKVKGRAGHAAYPHNSLDAVVMAAHVVTALQSIVSREIDPLKSAVLTLGQISGGRARNIIADEVNMSGTVRTLSKEVRDEFSARMQRVIKHTAEAFGGEAELDYKLGVPPVFNDEALVDLLAESAAEAIGQENVQNLKAPAMGGEDFAFYLEHAPGVFFRLGTANEDDPKSKLPTHNPKVIFDERALPVGMKVMCRAALNFLK